ncbi:MAG: PAS domain S-box protein [Nitrospirae bacterium]|nr:PAS domain S-box protein [Nitrospirota bacterium]
MYTYLSTAIILLGIVVMAGIRKQLKTQRVKAFRLGRTLDLIRDQLESLIESSTSVIYSRTPDERMTINFVSENVQGMLGYSSEELMQSPDLWINNVHPEDKEEVMERFKMLFSLGTLTQQYRFCHKDGVFHWIQDNMKVIADSTDSPMVILGSWIDVTAQVTSEQALVESEEMFRDMFEKNAAPMLLIEPAGETIYTLNDAAREYFGNGESILEGKPVSDILSFPEGRTSYALSHCHLNVQGTLLSGDVKEIEVHTTSITIKDRKMIFAILHDITEKIGFEKKLIEKTRELDSLNKDLQIRVNEEVTRRQTQEEMLIHQSRLASMGEMISAITHQWRQPLNTLALTVQDLEEAFTFGEIDDNYVKEFVSESLQQVKYMSSTIEDFKNFFKPSKNTKAFDVMASVREVLSLMSLQLKSYSIVVHCTSDGDTTVIGHPNEFKQAILNMLNNSKDAVAKNEKKEISVRGWEENGMVKLSISDTGGGIPQNYIDKIFQPYYTTKEKGTGIGLYMVKVIIADNMGGNISVANTTQGAEFIIELKKN